jgi:hypothetical protein
MSHSAAKTGFGKQVSHHVSHPIVFTLRSLTKLCFGAFMAIPIMLIMRLKRLEKITAPPQRIAD